MNLNRKKFLLGAVLALSILSISWFVWRPIKAADYPWNCSVSGSDLRFTNTEAISQYVGCVEYTNCNCPGEPREGFCEIHEHWNWVRQVAPGESGVCNYSQSVESLANCKVHQLDVKVWGGGDYEQQTGFWDSRPNCWFIVNKCDRCGEPTPTPTLGASPTPTPIVSSTPTPPSVTSTPPTQRGCWEVCGHDSECPGGLSCKQIDDAKRCVKSECEREQDCNCSAPTPPPVLGAQAPPILPSTGFSGWMLAGVSGILGLALFKLRKLVLHG